MDTLISKWIKGYEGLYSVRQDGAIRSHDRINSLGRMVKGKWLKFGTASGYPMVLLSKGGKSRGFLVHILVADAFIPNPNGLPCVNHKDEDKFNPHYSNLERCTQQYNSEYSNAIVVKLKSPTGEEILVSNLRKFCTTMGLDKSGMSRLVNGKQSSYKGWTLCH